MGAPFRGAILNALNHYSNAPPPSANGSSTTPTSTAASRSTSTTAMSATVAFRKTTQQKFSAVNGASTSSSSGKGVQGPSMSKESAAKELSSTVTAMGSPRFVPYTAPKASAGIQTFQTDGRSMVASIPTGVPSAFVYQSASVLSPPANEPTVTTKSSKSTAHLVVQKSASKTHEKRIERENSFDRLLEEDDEDVEGIITLEKHGFEDYNTKGRSAQNVDRIPETSFSEASSKFPPKQVQSAIAEHVMKFPPIPDGSSLPPPVAQYHTKERGTEKHTVYELQRLTPPPSYFEAGGPSQSRDIFAKDSSKNNDHQHLRELRDDCACGECYKSVAPDSYDYQTFEEWKAEGQSYIEAFNKVFVEIMEVMMSKVETVTEVEKKLEEHRKDLEEKQKKINSKKTEVLGLFNKFN